MLEHKLDQTDVLYIAEKFGGLGVGITKGKWSMAIDETIANGSRSCST